MSNRYLSIHSDSFCKSKRLVEQTEAHVLVGRLLLLFRRLLISLASVTTTSGAAGSSSWSRSSILVGVLNPVLELLNALPLNVGLNSNGQNVLV